MLRAGTFDMLRAGTFDMLRAGTFDMLRVGSERWDSHGNRCRFNKEGCTGDDARAVGSGNDWPTCFIFHWLALADSRAAWACRSGSARMNHSENCRRRWATSGERGSILGSGWNGGSSTVEQTGNAKL